MLRPFVFADVLLPKYNRSESSIQDFKRLISLGVIWLFIHLDVPYPREKLQWFSEIVHRLNDELAVLGGIGFNVHTGAMYMRYGVDLDGQHVTPDIFIRMLNRSAFSLRALRLGLVVRRMRTVGP